VHKAAFRFAAALKYNKTESQITAEERRFY